MDVRRIHGKDARVRMATVHADEALVSWSGAQHMFPIRSQLPGVDGGGHWTTVGYVPHIPMALEHTEKARLAVRDAHTDLFQRCIVIVLRWFVRASEVGYPVKIPGVGQVLLVSRVGGLVLDLMADKNVLALIGHMSDMISSDCRARRVHTCDAAAISAPRQSVLQTFEAHFFAAHIRHKDSRASLRVPLDRVHSALPFIPILGAMHGFSPGNHNNFNVIYFDSLHV